MTTRDHRREGSRPSLQSVLTRTHLWLTLLAVGLTTLAFALLATLALRSTVTRSLDVIAQSMSFNAQAAVVFQDRRAAYQAVAALATGNSDEISAVRVLNADGHLLAEWHRPRSPASALQAFVMPLARWLAPAPIAHPIMHDDKTVGSIHIASYAGQLADFLGRGLMWMLVCLSLSAAGAAYVSHRLARGLVAPLREFTRVAHAIGRERAFDRRVPAAPIVELDELGKDFNVLLTELDAWQRANRRERAKLVAKATRDDLTGLVKRAAFREHLQRAVADALRRRSQLALLYIDVDHFKQVNDRFGHDAAHITARLQASFGQPMTLPDGRRLDVSISIGVAVLPEHADNVESLIAAADAAMYSAKRRAARGWTFAEAAPTNNDPRGTSDEYTD